MSCVAEKINQLFEEIFAISAFGMSSQSTVLQLIFLSINSSITLIILAAYFRDGNLFISNDALSKFTDVVELFGPIFSHLVIISIFFMNRRKFAQLQALRKKLDRMLSEYDRKLYWRIEKENVMTFLFEVFVIQSVAAGIETFQMIR